MNNQTEAPNHNMGQLAEDARALMAATADVAGERVGEARKRLAAALERGMEGGRERCHRVREKVSEGAQMADDAVRKHPYQAIGTAVGVGALIGLVVASRRCRRD